MVLAYSAGRVIEATRKGWNSYGSALYCPECSATWDERNKKKPLSGPENTIKVIDAMYARDRWRGIDRSTEFAYMIQFADDRFLDEELGRDQFRALWTAYCFHHDIHVDTGKYDADMLQLWDAVQKVDRETADWSDFDSFDGFMCRYLV